MELLGQRGSGLVIAILTIVALFALGTALAFLTRTDVNISRHQTLHAEALYVAEAGAEEVIRRLELRDPTTITVNGSSINAAIRDSVSPYDPDWKTRIFLGRPGEEPSPTGASEFHTVTIQDAGTWLEYSSPSDLTAALAIEHKWKDLDDDGVREDGEIVLYDPAQYPPENFVSGKPIEVITVTGKSATAERTIKVEVTRFPVTANVLAALMCDMGVDVRGNVTVCGHDHSINTPHYTMLPNCKVWELCYGPPPRAHCDDAGCLIGVMTTGDEIDERGTTDLAGEPSPRDTSSTNQFLTLAEALGLSQEEVDALLAHPDYTDVDQASPQDGITYVDNAATGVAQWTGGGNGSGLLYTTGDLETGGNFMWKGLIYVEGDYKITGTPSIIGAVLVRGHSEYAFSGGNPCILYSSEAIAETVSKAAGYIRVGWKETSGL
jgi:hypothetical protein